jgi:hypothetical protein
MSFDPREIDRLLAEDGQPPVDSRVRSLLRTLRDDLRRPPSDEVAERHLARIFEAARHAPERLTLRGRAAHFMTRLMAATTVKVVIGATAAVAATSGIAATVNVPDPVQQIANVVVRTIVPLPSEDTRLARDAVIIAEEPRAALPEATPEPEPAPALREAATPTKPKIEAVAEEDEPVEDEPAEALADEPMDDPYDEPRSDFCPTDPWDDDEGLESGSEEAGEDETDDSAIDDEGDETESGSEEGDDLCYVDDTHDADGDDQGDSTTSPPGQSGDSRQGLGPP